MRGFFLKDILFRHHPASFVIICAISSANQIKQDHCIFFSLIQGDNSAYFPVLLNLTTWVSRLYKRSVSQIIMIALRFSGLQIFKNIGDLKDTFLNTAHCSAGILKRILPAAGFVSALNPQFAYEFYFRMKQGILLPA